MLSIVTQYRDNTKDPSDFFLKGLVFCKKPSDNMHGKDEHKNEIQWEFEVGNDKVDPSYHQIKKT